MEARGFALEGIYGHRVLSDAFGWAALEIVSGVTDCGDHDVVLCKVTNATDLPTDGREHLTTGRLRRIGLM